MSRRKTRTGNPTQAPAPLVLDRHEPSAWLRQAATALEATLPPTPGWTVVVPLGGRTEPGTRADRSCDHCGLYVAPRRGCIYPAVWQFSRPAGGVMHMALGLCIGCAEAEVPGWGEIR